MDKLDENEIEIFAIRLLQRLGYAYAYGPDISPEGTNPLRSSWDNPVLEEKLRAAIDRLNPNVPMIGRQEALRKVLRHEAPDLITNNETFHGYLTEGVPVSHQKNGDEKGDRVWLVDFQKPDNNEFLAVNQFTVIENNVNKRPDLVLFVNGLPLVVIELKNPADENATVRTAWNQLQTYKVAIPSLMAYNAILVVSDGLEALAGSLTAGFSRFAAWKSEDGSIEASPLKSQLEVLISGMLNKATLLDEIRFFTVFEKTRDEDKNGQIQVKTSKKIAAYHQYYAVNKAIKSTLEASTREDEGKGKGGVVWHTQGSGKSLSMVFYTGKIVVTMNNPTIVVLTDRNDLDDQLFDTFSGSTQLLRQEPAQAEDRDHLQELLKTASGGIVFTTIQKFQPKEGNVYPLLSDRRNIIVIADEAHRSQYGFEAHTVDVKDEAGNKVGKKTVYGLAKYLRDALPNAVYLGFTGTPIEKDDINTPAVFGNYIDVYDIGRAVEDGATVPIYYESFLVPIELPEEGRTLIEELDEELAQENPTEAELAKRKRARLEALIGSKARLQVVAQNIVSHFEEREKVLVGKGMVVCMSRGIAADLYDEIMALRPDWGHPDLDKGKLKVVMTASSDEGPRLSRFQTNKQQRRALAERMKNPDDELKMVIVCDMWLTGFDVPCLHTMYMDKPLKGHGLVQAIARVNRVFGDKPGGLIVDYLGIAYELKKALSNYSPTGKPQDDPVPNQEKALEIMKEKLEDARRLLHDFSYQEYFTADTSRKLAIILEAEEFILGTEDGKKRFLDCVAALSAAFSLAIPLPDAIKVRDEVAFLQAIKARLVKFTDTGGEGRDHTALEQAIKQVMDKALVAKKVIDVFDAAGIKKPDISILSEEFMLEMKAMKHKNVALELLKKLLNDEISARSKINLVQSKKLLDMLESALKRYHNKVITSAEFIDEMREMAQELVASKKEAKELGLTDYEYAFYTAVADNKSARELMQKDTLRELAVVLTDQVRKNTSIDWTIKENVRANLRVIIKRTLRKYGYPPDMQQLATETVMKQAELLAEELVGETG